MKEEAREWAMMTAGYPIILVAFFPLYYSKKVRQVGLTWHPPAVAGSLLQDIALIEIYAK